MVTEHDERPQDDAAQDALEEATAQEAAADASAAEETAQEAAPEADAEEAASDDDAEDAAAEATDEAPADDDAEGGDAAAEADVADAADAAAASLADDDDDEDEIAFLDEDEEPDQVFVDPQEFEQLKADLEAAAQARTSAEGEARQFKERLMRKAAELENFRKRSTREKNDAVQRAREKVIVEMLPVVDNLERALQHAPEDADNSLVDGVKMVLRQFTNQLQKFNVTGFDSVGEPFNPERHEAVMQRPSPDHPNNTVVEEYQRGYMVGERLLRPAMVVVAKN